MSPVNFDRVIESIPSFTSKELEQLQSTTSYLLSNNGHTPNISKSESEVINAFSKRLEAEGIRFGFNHQMLKKIGGWKSGVNEVVKFVNFFESTSQITLKKIERQVLLRLLFKLLIEDMKRIGMAITPKTTINNMSRIPDIFDRSFPGYLSSGLAYFVIKTNAKMYRSIERKKAKGGG